MSIVKHIHGYQVRLMRVLVAEGSASEKEVETYDSAFLTVEITKPSAQVTFVFK